MPNSRLQCRCGCKQRERRENMLITPSGAAFIDADHAASYGKERAARLRVRKEREERKVFKERKQEFRKNDYSYQFGLTKKTAQALANLLDAEKPCICCDAPRGSAQFCGGHYKTAGAHPELALDLLNIHGQRNKTCNMGKSGNIAGDKHSFGYRVGLIRRYGQSMLDYLDSYHGPKRRSAEELIALRKEYAAEIRRLKQGLPPSRDWRALPESRLSGRAITQTEAA